MNGHVWELVSHPNEYVDPDEFVNNIWCCRNCHSYVFVFKDNVNQPTQENCNFVNGVKFSRMTCDEVICQKILDE